MSEKLPDITKDFALWYQEIVQQAELADHAPVRGCMVIRPYGYALWEHIKARLDQRIKETGRDVSRKQAEMQKIVRSPHLAKVAKELSGEKMLRLGFDEIYALPLDIDRSMTLFEMSSIAPLVCAVMIALDGESDRPSNAPCAAGIDPFPHKRGNALFFSPSAVWDIEAVKSHEKQRCLLITYASPRALYIYQEKDPHMHLLKRLGYVFGDRLKDVHHPIVAR